MVSRQQTIHQKTYESYVHTMTIRYPGQTADPAPLGQPLDLSFSGRTAKNRLMKSAMTEYLCTWSEANKEARGYPTPEFINLYRAWGEGGFGVILTGNIMLGPDDIEGPGNAIVPLDTPLQGPRMDAFRELATAGKAGGSLFIAQLNHAGRQVFETLNPNPVSASDVHLDKEVMGKTFAKPHPATLEEIEHLKAAFVHAAVFLEEAGFDGIQLHAAHGYLLAQFLSLATNLRTDAYGGSLENRARLITEIADAIRAQTKPGFVLAIKINSVEFQDKGFSADEAAQLCELLEKHTFDFVELSGGTYEDGSWNRWERQSTKVREAFFLEFAEKIVPHLEKTKCFITGGLRTAGAMVEALGSVHGVGLGRPACTEPRLAADLLEGRVSSCIKPLLDDMDFTQTAGLANEQMKRIGNGQEPLDPSDQRAIDAFREGGTAPEGTGGTTKP